MYIVIVAARLSDFTHGFYDRGDKQYIFIVQSEKMIDSWFLFYMTVPGIVFTMIKHEIYILFAYRLWFMSLWTTTGCLCLSTINTEAEAKNTFKTPNLTQHANLKSRTAPGIIRTAVDPRFTKEFTRPTHFTSQKPCSVTPHLWRLSYPPQPTNLYMPCTFWWRNC